MYISKTKYDGTHTSHVELTVVFTTQNVSSQHPDEYNINVSVYFSPEDGSPQYRFKYDVSPGNPIQRISENTGAFILDGKFTLNSNKAITFEGRAIRPNHVNIGFDDGVIAVLN